MREYRFTIPVLPPSVNALHNIIYSQRKVVLKPEILKWRSDIAVYVPRIVLVEPDSLITVDLLFHYRQRAKNGKLRRFDCHNMIKVLLDVISWKANFDDSRIRKGSWDAVDSLDEKVEVVLRECVNAVGEPAPK